MSIVKLFCWEHRVVQQISEVRAREVSQLKKFLYTLALFMFLLYAALPVECMHTSSTFLTKLDNHFIRLSLSTLISVSTFTVYVLLGNTLSASQIFPALSIFTSLSMVVLDVLAPPSSVSVVTSVRSGCNVRWYDSFPICSPGWPMETRR